MTYSIVAADPSRHELGGAGTSCLEGQDVYVIYDAVPGHGVVHAQAYYNAAGRTRAAQLLAQGTAPLDIIASITAASYDRNASIRQYGIVDAQGRTAAFTGAGTDPFAADRQGSVRGLTYSVQGNLLTSERVLSQAASAFEAPGCDLAERLMNALEGGALNGEGDKRCTPSGIPSDSAFLQVESADLGKGQYCSLRVTTSGSDDPLPLLREKLSAWRLEHPCPAPPTAADSPPAEAAEAGCSCHLTLLTPPTDAWLLGSLLVVAWLRKRAPRLLRPIHAP